jgi:hypothetical protein
LHAQALRLCPCAALEPPTPGIHDAVAEVVARQLRSGEANIFIGRQYDLSKGHASICHEAQCPQSLALKTFDLTTLGLPSSLELLQSMKFGPVTSTRLQKLMPLFRDRRIQFSLAAAGVNCHSHCIAQVPPAFASMRLTCKAHPVALQRKAGQFDMCVRHWLEVLNSCDALSAAFPAHGECVQNLQGRDLPAYRPIDKKVAVLEFMRMAL